MLLDQLELTEAAAAGDPEASIGPIEINSDPTISWRSPYEFIYAKYDRRPALQVRKHETRKQDRPVHQKVIVPQRSPIVASFSPQDPSPKI